MVDIPQCSKCKTPYWRRENPKRVYIRESSSEWLGMKEGTKRTQKWVPVGWRCPKCKKIWDDPK